MSDAPVKAASFGTVLEAQAFVNRLALEDIRAHVIDGQAGTTLGYLGAAIGGIKVYVLPRHLERASQVLGEMHGEAEWGQAFAEDEEWSCAGCGAAVPGEHDVCWSCGAERTGEAAEAFEAVDPEDRTVGEDASAIAAPDARRAWDIESSQGSTTRRGTWAFVLLFAFAPFALLYLGILLIVRPEPDGPTLRQREAARTAFWGVMFMAAGAMALWAVMHGLPF